MSADALTQTAKLPHGVRVKFSWSLGRLEVEWEPGMPRVRSPRHRRKFLEAYAAARRDFMRTVATVIGGSVAILDVAGEVTAGNVGLELVTPATKH